MLHPSRSRSIGLCRTASARPARRFTRHARPAEGTLRLAHKYQHIPRKGTSNLKSSYVAAGPIFAAALPQKQCLRSTLRNRRRCTTFQVRRAWWAFVQGQTWCAILSLHRAPPSIERSHGPVTGPLLAKLDDLIDGDRLIVGQDRVRARPTKSPGAAQHYF